MFKCFFISWYSTDPLQAPGEAEAELAHLNSTGVIDAVMSDDVDNFLFGAKMVVRKCVLDITLLNCLAHPSHLVQAPPSQETARTLQRMLMVMLMATTPWSTLQPTSSHTHLSS